MSNNVEKGIRIKLNSPVLTDYERGGYEERLRRVANQKKLINSIVQVLIDLRK